MNFQVERLRRLPQSPGETWQGGVFKMLTWVLGEEDERPVRPWITAWISLKTRLIHMSAPRTEETDGFEVALQALADFASNEQLAGYRPTKLQVKDPALAEYLREMLAELEVEVELRDRLVVLEQVLLDMAQKMTKRPLLPGALDVKGVTVDVVRAFADAAAEFHRAKPWRYLSSDDLIEIESPLVEAGMRYATVLGAGGSTFGLGFYQSRNEIGALLRNPHANLTQFGQRWSVLYVPISDLPFGDVDLWEDQDLPVADEDAYPLAICFDSRGKHRRPGPEVLAFFEGLLRALAKTTEEEMDTGRWNKRVDTLKGPMDFTLSLPDLLAPQEPVGREKRRNPANPLTMDRFMVEIEHAMEGREFKSQEEMRAFLDENFMGKYADELEATTPLARAQDLVFRAYETSGRRQIHLARQALEVSPDCADAYTLLAERTPDPDKKLDYYKQAIQTAERTLGPDIFQKEAGRFWDIIQTRPYMRARFGLAQLLEALGQLEEAAQHYQELIRLNEGDNQGARYHLWPCLLKLGRDDEVNALLEESENDQGECVWNHMRALLTFRQEGDTPTARQQLRQAIKDNAYTADYLLGNEAPVRPPAPYEIGSEDEAISCVRLLIEVWLRTPGALEWLEEVVQRPH
ncbi:MAG: hypothetical protein A2Y76_09770 [Planctomycetes bacterium RBG_13_60_9]|nr:MAG: hypothetical protein A2Y76_09770 [Planctomycetes bacterium RBG_13_60_9]